jgi:hypothetical protein
MPKKDAPRASADTASGQARRKRHRRNPLSAPVPEPQPHHRARTNLELPGWLPPPIATYAQQIFTNSRPTMSDELLLRRLISDERMNAVWTELLKRRRSKYKSSEAFKYPATSQMDWSQTVRARLRRAQTIRAMSGPYNEGLANKIAASAGLARVAQIYAWGSNSWGELPIQERALVAFFSQAFEFARTDSIPVPHAVAQQKRAHYLDMANLIRTDVLGPDSGYHGQALIDAAFAYEEMADKTAPPPDHPLHVHRKRSGDERQTAFVIQLVDASIAIFDLRLCGTVAIAANVAFDCEN